MSALTKAARGRPCLIRLPDCSGGGEDTVGCHFRSISLGAGMGIKTPDWCLAHGCDPCHSAVDGRRHIEGHTKTDIRLAHAIGVLRTIDFLMKEGILKVNSRMEIA